MNSLRASRSNEKFDGGRRGDATPESEGRDRLLVALAMIPTACFLGGLVVAAYGYAVAAGFKKVFVADSTEGAGNRLCTGNAERLWARMSLTEPQK